MAMGAWRCLLHMKSTAFPDEVFMAMAYSVFHSGRVIQKGAVGGNDDSSPRCDD